MTLNTKPKGLQPRTARSEAEEDAAFDRIIAKSPDIIAATENRDGISIGSRQKITHLITPELLREVNNIADRVGETRNAIINFAILRALYKDIFK